MSDWGIRARGVIADQFVVVVAVLLVLAAAGGWVTYSTYVNPGTHTEQVPASSWETNARFDHAATVTEPNSVYDVGTTLENRSAYFGAIAPVLDGNFTYGYTASDGGSVDVRTSTELVLRSVKRDREENVEAVYWQTKRDLGSEQRSGVNPGQTVTVPFSFNARTLANQSSRINDELGGTVGSTESLVRVTVALSGTVNGERVDRTETYVLPLGVGDVYTVNNPGEMGEEHTDTRTVTVPNEYGPLQRLGGPALLALSLAGLAGLVVARRRDSLDPTDEEREYLAYREARSDFDEWINAIRLPASVRDRPRAEAASLGDLVDFAIDTNNSVLEDPDDGTYYVVHGEYLYTYDPPEVDGGDGLGPGEADTSPEPEADVEDVSTSEPDAGEATGAESTSGSRATGD